MHPSVITNLLERVEKLETQVAAMLGNLEARAPMRAVQQEAHSVAQQTEGKIPRGKYKGYDHNYVVDIDPQHVVWVADNGFAIGLGYTEDHIKIARATIPLKEAS